MWRMNGWLISPAYIACIPPSDPLSEIHCLSGLLLHLHPHVVAVALLWFTRFWKILVELKDIAPPIVVLFFISNPFKPAPHHPHTPHSLVSSLAVYLYVKWRLQSDPLRKHLLHLPHAMICAGYRSLAPPCRHTQCKTTYTLISM